MDEQTAKELLERLVKGEMDQCRVEKEDFLVFRKALTERSDFKHFHGVAHRGGAVVFFYRETPRS